MVVTPEGLPITIQVYPGDTTDNTTVVGMVERLTPFFGLKEGIYVGDRGMKSTEVLEDLHTHGFHYVLAEVNRNVEETIFQAQKRSLAPVGPHNAACEVVDPEGRGFIVLLNAERRKTELETLDHRIAQGQAILDQLGRSWAKRPRHHHTLLRQAQAALAAKGLSDLFDIGWDETTLRGLTAKLKEGRRRQRRLAGWWVLTTDTDRLIEEVARLYLGLAVIEQGWRELKRVLEVRPLRHRLTRRVGAHLVICTLAYLIQQHLELKVKDQGVSGAKAIERFRSLILNENEVSEARMRFFSVTRLSTEQEAILRAIDVDPRRFQRGWERLGPTPGRVVE